MLKSRIRIAVATCAMALALPLQGCSEALTAGAGGGTPSPSPTASASGGTPSPSLTAGGGGETPSLAPTGETGGGTTGGLEANMTIADGPIIGGASPAIAVSALSFASIPAGSFTMGSPEDEPGRFSDETQHQVTLTHGFDLQRTEVTQGQWKAYMGNDPAGFSYCGPDCPVERVSWWDAASFANAVSASASLPACYTLASCGGTAGEDLSCSEVRVDAPGGDPYQCAGYRLPTEAEWEYAYRAGTTTAFYNGDITEPYGKDPKLDLIGWYGGNSGSTTHPVALKAPNAWGLFDMAGNVYEWAWDWYGDFPSGSATDPRGTYGSDYRVVRGGSLHTVPYGARAANRGAASSPSVHRFYVGFRLARSRP